MSTPTIARVLPVVEPKPPVRQSIPGSTNYFYAGVMFNADGLPIHAACLETAEFCDCDPRYSPPNVAHLFAGQSAGAR